MYHYNGKQWIRLTPPSTNNVVATNFHGLSHNAPLAEHCPVKSPVTSTSRIEESNKGETSNLARRTPLKQLFPRTPTPFKKAYAEAVKKGGVVGQIDLEKSPELFEDLQEIILQDVILPPRSKKSRKLVSCALADEPSTSSAVFPHVQYDIPEGDSIFDTTSTPSKILNDSNCLLSPPFAASVTIPTSQSDGSVEEKPPPKPYSSEWFRIVCGRTPAQVELTYMAKELLRSSFSDRRPSMGDL